MSSVGELSIFHLGDIVKFRSPHLISVSRVKVLMADEPRPIGMTYLSKRACWWVLDSIWMSRRSKISGEDLLGVVLDVLGDHRYIVLVNEITVVIDGYWLELAQGAKI